jgi:hypothetical protein
MASTINATTASGGGVITTADSSGDLNIQSSGTTIAAITSTGVAVTGTLTVNGASLIPAGTIIQFSGTTPPTGYLTCPTSATTISRTTYAALFAAIGTTWGAGDGSTTFGIPWFAAGYAMTQANSNVATATVGQNLAHTHSFTQYQATGGGNSSAAAVASVPVTTTTSSNGGTANLAASTAVLFCVKF